MRVRFLLAAYVVFSLTGAASAADLPARMYTKAPPVSVAPAFSWTGAYIGLTAGYDWGHAQFSVPAGSGGSFHDHGGIIGATLGYNWQTGPVVFGLEADASVSGLGGHDGLAGPCPRCEITNRWIGTLRGRLGFSQGTTMVYATGGGAYGGIRVRDSFGGDETDDRTGWTAGGGVEHAIGRKWSVKVEYLYVDFGTPQFSGQLTTPFKENIIRLGINGHF